MKCAWVIGFWGIIGYTVATVSVVVGQDAEAPVAASEVDQIPGWGAGIGVHARAALELERAQLMAGQDAFRHREERAQALRALQNAKSDEDRDRAKSRVRALLSQEFDRMIEQEAKSLDQLEKRLDKLRDQIERRREAKSKLVDLRFETLMNEAHGLGWPGGQESHAWFGFGNEMMEMFPPTPLPTPTAQSSAR
ncbi:MAG TPA: hypothetical protein VIY86_04650 [Pirellulaceae bacterium]